MFKINSSQCPIILTPILLIFLSFFSQYTWAIAPKFELLHSFGENEVADSPLINDAFGNHYGIVSNGGAKGFGIVYRLTPAGQYRVVYTFNGAYGKVAPKLILGKGGKFYGWTMNTSPSNVKSNAVIYVIELSQTPSTFKVLHKVTGNKAISDLILGRSGKLYGAEQWDGQPAGYSKSSIFQLDISKPSPLYRNIYTHSSDRYDLSFTNLIQYKSGVIHGVAIFNRRNYDFSWHQDIFTLDIAAAAPVYSILREIPSQDDFRNTINISLGNNGILYGVVNNEDLNYTADPLKTNVDIFQLDTSSNTPIYSPLITLADYKNGRVIQGVDGRFYLTTASTVFHLRLNRAPMGINHLFSTIEGGLSDSFLPGVTQGLDGRFYGVFNGKSIYRIRFNSPCQCLVTNSPPVAKSDFFALTIPKQKNSITIPAPGVLNNDSDPEKNKLTVSNPTNVKPQIIQLSNNGGKVTLFPDGHFTYSLPYVGFYGTRNFTYQATDGNAMSNSATVTLTIKGNN